MITFQENTHFSQALPCSKEEFWAQVRKPNTAWRIDARRAIIAAVEASKTQGVAAIQTWLNNADYQKFLLKKQKLKKQAAIDAWNAKTDAEKLLAFAQEIKDNSVAFIYSCYEFDETQTEKGKPFRHRRLADCHLNGLVMLDLDHVENPMQIWYQLRDNQELMARVKLVHITSSGYGIRIVFTANIEDGNLADNQIVFAQALGQKPDESCIDATRNSFAPKEEDIMFIDDTLFDYYDEDFDKKFTPMYREKKTQPMYHQFPSDDRADGDGCAKTAAVANKAAAQGSGALSPVDDNSVEGVANVQWSMFNGTALPYRRLLMPVMLLSCLALTTATDTRRVLSSPRISYSCSMVIRKPCSVLSKHRAGCRRSSQNAMRTWRRRWNPPHRASRRKRRSMPARCHPSPCSKR